MSILDHKCYIQPVVKEEGHEETEKGGGCMVASPPPLFVYMDSEAMQNADGVFVANLLLFVDGGRDDPSVGGGGLCPTISS